MKIEINIDDRFLVIGKRVAFLGLLVGLAYPAYVLAGVLTVPNTFTANTVISASEMNANFTAINAEVDDNASRISVLEAASGGEPIMFRINQDIFAGQTWFASSGASLGSNEEFGSGVAPRAGVLANLTVLPSATFAVGSQVSTTVRVNGVDTLLSIVYTAVDGTTAKTDSVNTVAVVQGDRISVRIQEDNGVGPAASLVGSYEFR